MDRPDTPTPAPQEILITLRALAGLVVEARWRTAASGDAAFARESATLAFWRAFQVSHTRRLLPSVVGAVDASACRVFAAHLVHAIYREEWAAASEHGSAGGHASRHRLVDLTTADLMGPLKKGRRA